MKKIILSFIAVLAVVAALFAYVLFTEGAFETLPDTPKNEQEPFQMKCEPGKCSAGKCAAGK